MSSRVTTRPRSPKPPPPHALLGVGVIVLSVIDGEEHVLLGRHRNGTFDLPGGKAEPGEALERAAARELLEETGLHTESDDVDVFALLVDDNRGVARLTAAALVREFLGEPAVQPGEPYENWAWTRLSTLPDGLFTPSGQVLRARWPHLPIDHPPTLQYAIRPADDL